MGWKQGSRTLLEVKVNLLFFTDRVVAVISGSENKKEGVEWSAQAKSTYI